MHACWGIPQLEQKPVAPEEKMQKKNEKLNIYACMHACLAIPQLGAGCT